MWKWFGLIALVLVAACENRVEVRTSSTPPAPSVTTGGPGGGGDGVSTGWPGPIISLYRVYDSLGRILQQCETICLLDAEVHSRLMGLRILVNAIPGRGQEVIQLVGKGYGQFKEVNGRFRLFVNPRAVFNENAEMELERLFEALLYPLMVYNYPDISTPVLWFETQLIAAEVVAHSERIFEEPLAEELADYFPLFWNNRS